jgi:hypothetical protein
MLDTSCVTQAYERHRRLLGTVPNTRRGCGRGWDVAEAAVQKEGKGGGAGRDDGGQMQPLFMTNMIVTVRPATIMNLRARVRHQQQLQINRGMGKSTMMVTQNMLLAVVRTQSPANTDRRQGKGDPRLSAARRFMP